MCLKAEGVLGRGAPLRLLLQRRGPLSLGFRGQEGTRSSPHSPRPVKAGRWRLPQHPGSGPTLQRRSFLSQTDPVLADSRGTWFAFENDSSTPKARCYGAGERVPNHIPLALPPPPQPTPGPALLGFLSPAHQRQLAAAWAGQTGPMPWDRARWTLRAAADGSREGQEAGLQGQRGQLGLF